MSVNASGPINRVVVTGDGEKVSSLAGTHLLGAVAQRLGVASGFSQVLAGTTQRVSAYDRGTVLAQLSMMLASGGRSLSDLRVLRDQPDLFGQVASDPTAWRAVHQVDDELLAQLREVRVGATRRLLSAAGADELVLDVDATLIDIDSEQKQGAAATFKGGFGFHPVACTIEPVGVTGGVRLRPGNATANNAADQLAVIDEAIDSLPAVWRAGHRPGDEAFKVNRDLVLRGDTAACSRAMLTGLMERNLVFSVGLRASEAAAGVVADLDDDVWIEAIDTDGRVRTAALVAEVAQLVPAWAPTGTRAIVRRERAHPGAKLRLWDYDGWRHQVVLTNDTHPDIARLELRHRRHAQVENRIKNLKDTGLARLPFHAWDANQVWVELVAVAGLLLAALQVLVDDDDLAVAEPRRLRYTLLHIAARIAHHARRVWLKLDRSWPWTPQLLGIYDRLSTIPATVA